MVKGVSRQVVVVRSLDTRLFEQAIFILKEDLHGKGKRDASEVLREAQQVADEYVKSFSEEKKSILSRFPPSFFAAVGALAGSLICFLLLSFI